VPLGTCQRGDWRAACAHAFGAVEHLLAPETGEGWARRRPAWCGISPTRYVGQDAGAGRSTYPRHHRGGWPVPPPRTAPCAAQALPARTGTRW
jgi:hypothetical protein